MNEPGQLCLAPHSVCVAHKAGTQNYGVTSTNSHTPAGAARLICVLGSQTPPTCRDIWEQQPGMPIPLGCAGCCCSLLWQHRQPSLHHLGIHSGFAAINLIGHWMSMLPHPITSGKVVDLQKGEKMLLSEYRRLDVVFFGEVGY